MTLVRRRLLLVAALTGASAASRAQGTSEAALKARLVLNLMRFTQWPADGEPLLCVAARADSVRSAFTELQGQAVAGRPLRVQVNPTGLPAGCRALYLDAEAESSAAALLVAAAALPVLTVGDGDAFVARGMVGLINVNDAIRFEVNLARMRAAQVVLSSQVLRLARAVRE
jgi:hypothetical protein